MGHWWTHSQENSHLERVSLEEFKDIVETAPPRRDIRELILHHTYAPTAADYNGHSTWEGIDRYHQQVRGWSDIGYHIGIAPDRSIWLLRPVTRSGAHANYHNRHSIGVTMIGNYDRGHDDPTVIAPSAAQVMALLCLRYQLTERDVNFHRDFANKSCPGSAVARCWIRGLVANAIARHQTPPPDETEDDEPDTDRSVRYFVEDPTAVGGWREHLIANGPDDAPVGKVFLRAM